MKIILELHNLSMAMKSFFKYFTPVSVHKHDFTMNRLRIFFVFIASWLTLQSHGQNDNLFLKQMAVGFEEKQGQYAALDTRLVNEKGDTVLLKDIINKPTILNLVYYQCPGTCSPLMFGISKFIDALDLKLGTDYDVLTISIDHNEGINLGINKKASYINTMQKKEEAQNWHFFVSDSADIAKLTNSVGFNFEFVNNQFVHPTGLIALAPDGKIIRYLRGIDFLPFDIKITLVEAADGKIGPSLNRLLAVCYSYDASGNKFVFNVTRVSAIIILFFLVLLFAYLSLKRIISKKKTT
jgi:protein SCO1